MQSTGPTHLSPPQSTPCAEHSWILPNALHLEPHGLADRVHSDETM
jgi:hypothetical protein